MSLKRQETELKTAPKLPSTVSVYISVGVQRAQRRGVVCVQGAQQGEGVGRACKAGTANCRASSTQEGSKASSTASEKEGINGIGEGTSSSVRARGGSSSSADQETSSSSSRTGTTVTAGPIRPNRRVHSSSIKRSMRGRRISRRVSSSKEREVIFDADGAESRGQGDIDLEVDREVGRSIDHMDQFRILN